MGDPSELRFVPASSSTTPIDWTQVPEDSKALLLKGWGYDWDKGARRDALPATVGELAAWFDECKFFGYMKPAWCKLLMDIKFGLAAQAPAGSRIDMREGPRFYMRYVEQVWVLVFTPGTRGCIIANSEYIPFGDNVDWEALVMEDTALAQRFDETLPEEYASGRASNAFITNRLGDWDASMVDDVMRQAELVERRMALPREHPVYRQMVDSVSRSLGYRH